jgi:cytochrome P450
MLEQCRARLGPMFTLKIAYEGDWVIVSEPEVVKQVFTGDPKIFHAGEGNQILRPLLGENSVLVLDEKRHIGQRRLLLPPFHGERMRAYEETVRTAVGREVDSWPLGEPFAVHSRMQAITLEVILKVVFGVADGPRFERLRSVLTQVLEETASPVAQLTGLASRRFGGRGPWACKVDRLPQLAPGHF